MATARNYDNNNNNNNNNNGYSSGSSDEDENLGYPFEFVEPDLECIICTFVIRGFTELPCGHAGCKLCIEEWEKRQGYVSTSSVFVVVDGFYICCIGFIEGFFVIDRIG